MDKNTALKKLYGQFQSFMTEIYPEGKIWVFGDGNPDGKVVLVGEAPGEQETLMQKPFVGQAGRNLTAFLSHAGLERDALYITNVVKFRPTRPSAKTGKPINRPPSREEVDLCAPWLYRELSIIEPQWVVTLGNHALRACTGDTSMTIGNAHGTVLRVPSSGDRPEYRVFALYHPASTLYNPGLKTIYEQDLDRLRLLLQQA